MTRLKYLQLIAYKKCSWFYPIYLIAVVLLMLNIIMLGMQCDHKWMILKQKIVKNI